MVLDMARDNGMWYDEWISPESYHSYRSVKLPSYMRIGLVKKILHLQWALIRLYILLLLFCGSLLPVFKHWHCSKETL